jgi:hypothetical protein
VSLIIFADGFGDLPVYKFYNDTVTLLFDKATWKYYKVESDGSRTPQYGVTNVLKIIDKSEVLIPWALKRAMLKLKKLLKEGKYVVGTLAVNDQVDPHNILFEEILDDIIAQAKKASKEDLEDAGEVGHQAHEWIESYILAILSDSENRRLELLSKLPEDERAASCVMAALAWMSEHNVRWLATERKCYSLKYSVAGTMDGLAIVDSCTNTECCPKSFKDRKSLIDWKSSNGLYGSYLMQAALYQQCYQEETGEEVEDRWVIRLDKVSGEFDPWYLSGKQLFEQDLAGFLNALALYKSVHQIENRIDEVKAQKRAREKEKVMQERQVKCLDSSTYKGVRKKRGCNDSDKLCSTCTKIYLDKHPEVIDNGS